MLERAEVEETEAEVTGTEVAEESVETEATVCSEGGMTFSFRLILEAKFSTLSPGL